MAPLDGVDRPREHDLSGRVALVTGAASGIGSATARLLASRGAVVYAADLNDAGLREDPTVGTGAQSRVPVRLDVREEAEWERAIGGMLDDRDRLDVLVHAAGVSAASPLADTGLDEWRRVMSTNLDGSFLAIKHGIRAMGSSGGAIALLGSASGIRPSAGAAAYSTSKAGVGMLARVAAKECRDSEIPIRINVLSPGGVRTPMWESMPFFQDLVRQHGSVEGAFEAMEAQGGGRFADPEEVAESVLFLVSDASRHVTGIELAMDDGYTL